MEGCERKSGGSLRVEHWEGEPRLVGDAEYAEYAEYGKPQKAKRKVVEQDALRLAGIPVLTAFKPDGTEVRVRKGGPQPTVAETQQKIVEGVAERSRAEGKVRKGSHVICREATGEMEGHFGTEKIKQWFERYDNTAGSSCSEELKKIADGLGERFKNLVFTWDKGFLHINGGKTLIQLDTVRDAYRTLGTLGVDKDVQELVVKLLAKKVGTLFCGLR